MSFSSLTFIFLFLPISFLIFYITPKKIKKYIVLLISILFYTLSSINALPVLLCTIIVNYLVALAIDKCNNKKVVLTSGILLNALQLVFYKYTNFIFDNINNINNINNIFSMNVPEINLILPLGISFYTFQVISYLVLELFQVQLLGMNNLKKIY